MHSPTNTQNFALHFPIFLVRYEKEVNHGHRSAIKRILEGDALPSSRMVLCISSICLSNTEVGCQPIASRETKSGAAAKIELTDGWLGNSYLIAVFTNLKSLFVQNLSV